MWPQASSSTEGLNDHGVDGAYSILPNFRRQADQVESSMK